MLKVLKVILNAGNQTLEVPNDCEIIANLYSSLDGVVLLVRMTDSPSTPPSVTPDIVFSPEEKGLESKS